MGRKEEAISESGRAVVLGHSPLGRTQMECMQALVYARTGRTEQAITMIGRLLTTPGAVSVGRVHLGSRSSIYVCAGVVNEAGVSPDPANPQFTRRRNVKAYLTFDTQLSYTYTAPKAEPGERSPKDGNTATASASYRSRFWQQWLDNTTIRVGINNIFDEPPPFNAGAFNDNYDTSLYSLRGRFYFIGLHKKF